MGMMDVRRRVMLAGALKKYTATGNPLTFVTGIARPLRSLLVPFSPKQSGTGNPAPDNVRPISGWTGLNVFHAGGNLIDDSKKCWSSGSEMFLIGQDKPGYLIPLKAGKYTISCEYADGEHYGMYYRKSDAQQEVVIWSSSTDLTEKTFTISVDGMYQIFAYRGASAGGVDPTKIANVMLEVGETVTHYAHYTGKSFPVDWTDEAGTVYGGTLDLVTGVLTVEWREIVRTWGDFSNKTSLGDNTRGTLSISSFPSKPTSGAVDTKCNIAPRNTGWSTDSIHFYMNEGSCVVFLPNDTDASTEIKIVYPLATPQTIQLDPVTVNALAGDNTIWSDANGDLTAVYLKKG